MFRHPYRDAGSRPVTSDRVGSERPCLEDHALTVALFIVGGLGVLVGVARPARTVELSLGLMMLFFAARGALAERLRRR